MKNTVRVKDGGDIEVGLVTIYDGTKRGYLDIDTGEDSWVYITAKEARRVRLYLSRVIRALEKENHESN